jgi:hypothetical protein
MTKNVVKEVPKVNEEPKRKSGGGNIVTRNVGSLLSGAFLSKEKAVQAVPFIFFLTFLTLLYIANGYYAEGQIRKMNSLNNQLKELRSEYIISKSDLSALSLQSVVVEKLKQSGVKESTAEPPRKIVVPAKDKVKK